MTNEAGVQGEGRTALVLAGAVAQGAFGAGAVSYLADNDVRIGPIAATSSGALTAAVVAAGVATGELAYAAGVAKDLWLDHAAWKDIAHVSPADWLHARGVMDTSRVIAIVREGIQRVVEHARGRREPAATTLTLVMTSLGALANDVEPLPTYEKAVVFATADLLAPTKWDAIATAAAASATFPGVFAPTIVDGTPCIDGGAVNNAPISYALDDPGVRRVIVVTSESSHPPETRIGGAELIEKLADIVIHERIAHDLAVANKTNALLKDVKAALESTGATDETRAEVLRALGWRELDLRVIRPAPPLSGTSFSGFSDRALRQEYIEAGARAAAVALAK
jgi:NTE family protein